MHSVVDEAQLTRLFKVVAQLKQQANLTDKINAQNKAHTIIENNTLFSPSLFSTDSDCFSSYTDELEIKVKRLLIDILLGFFAGKKWDGNYLANGTIVMKKSGDCVGFHIIDSNS